jgi:hypothetical protein
MCCGICGGHGGSSELFFKVSLANFYSTVAPYLLSILSSVQYCPDSDSIITNQLTVTRAHWIKVGGVVAQMTTVAAVETWDLEGMLLSCLQYGLSRLMGYLRGKTVTVSDQRVRLITEILSYMKFIKMYAWEKCFAKALLSKSLLCFFTYDLLNNLRPCSMEWFIV